MTGYERGYQKGAGAPGGRHHEAAAEAGPEDGAVKHEAGKGTAGAA